MCPITTLFTEELRTCDYWYNVVCDTQGKKDSAGSKQEESRQKLITVKEIPTHIIVKDRARNNQDGQSAAPPASPTTTTTSTTSTTPKPTSTPTTTKPSTTSTSTEAVTEQPNAEKYVPDVRREIWVFPGREESEPILSSTSTSTNNPTDLPPTEKPYKRPENPARKRNTAGQQESGLIGAVMNWMGNSEKLKPESENEFNQTYKQTLSAFNAPTERTDQETVIPTENRRGQPSFSSRTHLSFDFNPSPVYVPDPPVQKMIRLTSPSPLQAPPPRTTEGTLHAPPYDYPYQAPFHQDYVDMKGKHDERWCFTNDFWGQVVGQRQHLSRKFRLMKIWSHKKLSIQTIFT